MLKYDELYEGDYQPSGAYWGQIANKAGLPQARCPQTKGLPRSCFLKSTPLSWKGGNSYKTRACRKAAWAIDELDRDIIGKGLAEKIEAVLKG